MAEDAVRMEEIGNAYINFNCMNQVFKKKLCVRKSGRMKQFHEKDIMLNVMLAESTEV